MFTTFIVQPLFNLLALIYAILPGHNFGFALVIFTIIIRLALWPMVKKQLHQAKAMRKLQPEIKKIKKASKGNKTQESQMLMELYKERGINPFATFPTLIVQFIILIGLYSGLNKLIHDPSALVTFTYPFVHNLPWMQELAHNIHLLDNTLFGFVDLSKAALPKGGGIYWPAMLLVVGSAFAQYFQTKQLMPSAKDGRSLRTILKEAGSGQAADQSEVNAAVMGSTRFLLPVMIFVFTVSLASALSLYWLVGGIVAYIQQSIVLNKDEEEMEAIADKPGKNVDKIPEAEIVTKKTKTSKAAAGKNQPKKRRKKR
ncbi:MAG: YidC/Oxa1 family membrane protein insertase [Patescibacteria group bacterium]